MHQPQEFHLSRAKMPLDQRAADQPCDLRCQAAQIVPNQVHQGTALWLEMNTGKAGPSASGWKGRVKDPEAELGAGLAGEGAAVVLERP
jgi:hypothetical protein